MTKHKLLASGLCLFFLAGAVLAQKPAETAEATARSVTPVVPEDIAKRIKKEGLENSQVMAHLDYLTNTIGQRLTGSDNFERAARWARDRFRSWGLEAELEKWGEWKVRWERGQWQGRVLSPVKMELQVATSAWTAGTKGRVQGPLLSMPRNVNEVEKLGQKLKGAYLLDTRRGRMFRARRGPDRLETALAELGIAGYVRSCRDVIDRRYPNQIRVFGSYRVALAPNHLPTSPVIIVRGDEFKELRKLVDTRDEDKQDAPVKVEFEIRNRFRVEPVPLYNVIAEIKGVTKPDEIVAVGGHLDSWHQATGATDNGTGAATTLEAARILAAVGAKPKRTIRFCLWGGEEQGLMGSRQHVIQHRQEMNKVSAYLNHDSGTNWCHAVRVTEAMFDDMQRVMAPVMTMNAPEQKHEGPVFQVLKAQGGMRGGGSDHASFLAAGVPAWSWGLKGRAVYGYGWHSQWDTYDIAIPEYQRHTATVIALAALGIANLPHMLSRKGLRARGGQGRRRGRQARPIVEGYLGVELKAGLVIDSVSKDSLAQKSGLEPGDKIVKFHGRDVQRAWEVTRIMRDTKAPWTVTVKRGDRQVKIKLGSAQTPPAPRRQRRR